MLKNENVVFPICKAIVSDNKKIVKDPIGLSRYENVLLFDDVTAEFKVNVFEDGIYELVFSYYAPWSDLCQFMYVNDVMYKIGFNICLNGYRQISYNVKLHKGENSIKLFSKGRNVDHESGEIYVESISFKTFNSRNPEALYTLPSVYPRTNYLYKNLTHTLEYTVMDPTTLLDVRVDGISLPFVIDKTVMQDGELNFFNQENVKVDFSSLESLEFGKYKVTFDYGEDKAYSELVYCEKPKDSNMTITYIDVGHGCSVFMRLDNNKTVLIDTGYDYMTKDRVVPFLKSNKVEKIDYYMTTHYDPDHVGGKELIEENFEIGEYMDCFTLKIGDKLKWGEGNLEILNAYVEGEDLNRNSISFRFEYNGFVYGHGGDFYADGQKAVERRTPQNVKCHIYHGNHHFFGSLDPHYLIRANPYLFVMGVNVHCYSKAAHTKYFMKSVEEYLKSHQGRLIETIRGYQTGNLTVRINSGDDFTYETYRENNEDRNI